MASDDLTTARLTLRRFTPADEDDLVALNGDPDVMRFLTGGQAIPRAQIRDRILPRFIARSALHAALGYWAAHAREGGDFLGWFGLHPVAGDAAAGGWVDTDVPAWVELGYRLRRAAWGRGLATEGSRALIDRAFRDLAPVRRVVATTYQYNVGSRRVMEKFGLAHIRSFKLIPAEQIDEGNHTSSGEIWEGDEVEYALDRADWARGQGPAA